VRDLTARSDYLQSLDDRFFDVALQGRMKLFWAYETRTSPTVAVSCLLCIEGELTNVGQTMDLLPGPGGRKPS